jgi:hypothetical protein
MGQPGGVGIEIASQRGPHGPQARTLVLICYACADGAG